MSVDRLRLTVAHNNDPELVPRLAEFGSVESVFAKMPNDLVGGGRNTYVLKELNIQQLKSLVDQAHQNNIKFLYLLNASCLSNLELTRSYNNKLYAFVGTLVDMGVDGVVVAAPYLLDFIKRHFPSMKVSVSTFAIINSIKKAKLWANRGADRLIIMQDVNRDFTLLRKIRQAVSCELELFANNMCVDQCPYPPFHAAFQAHASSSADSSKGFGVDYCGYNCTLRRLENPVEFLHGRFIRPEDIHLYQDIGIDVFKLSDRVKPSDWIVNAARAYHERRYDGNLVDLISYPYLRGKGDSVLSRPAKWLLRPELINLKILKEMAAIGQSESMVYIDNRKLDGFAEHFMKHDCKNTICGEECKHCSKFAAKAVSLDEEKAAAQIAHHKEILEMVVSRSAFESEPLLKRLSIKAVRAAMMTFGVTKLK